MLRVAHPTHADGVVLRSPVLGGEQAPLEKARPLADNGNTKTICTAGEWYMFPSHFFLPEGPHFIGFIEGNFHGLLPDYYTPTRTEVNGTLILGTRAITNSKFNDLNQEVKERYTNISSCDALVLVCGTRDDGTAIVPSFIDRLAPQSGSAWRVTLANPLLDPSNSPSSIARAYYIPGYSWRRNKYKVYALLERAKPSP